MTKPQGVGGFVGKPRPGCASNPNMKPNFRRRDQGIALLLVLIALVLIGALAAEVKQTSVIQSRVGRNSINDFLLRTAVDGRVHILRAALKYDATGGQSIDAEDEDWSWFNRDELSSWGERASDAMTESGSEEAVSYTNTNVQLVAYCEDERSKLNLLGLSRPRDTPEFTNTRATLLRLIDEFREDYSNLDLTESDAQEMVEDLVDWLEDVSEEDENPMPPVASGRGRLQSVSDLLRVPGGKWKHSILYDVLDPDRDPEEEEDYGEGEDGDFRRINGIPGLAQYLTVHMEPTANAPLRININTAPVALMRALFDTQDADLADAIVANRREGAGSEDEEDGSAAADDEDSGFFTNKSQMKGPRIEGMAEELSAYPRLDFFADTRSDVFSLRIIATMVTGTEEGGSYDPDDEESEGPRDIVATYQYREVVQRTDQGFITLFIERRHDPIYDQ